MKITVVGDGGWGTALSILLNKNKHDVKMWGAFSDYVQLVSRTRVNKKFLPGIKIPKAIKIGADLEKAIDKAQLVVLAVPSQHMNSVLTKIKKLNYKNAIFLSVAKGLEFKSQMIMSQLIEKQLNTKKIAVLSGPNIAYEVACGIPSAAVCSSRKKDIANLVQLALMNRSFRVYSSTDIKGVELAGAFKNIIAIACGIADGLGFGTNTKAALLTRGLVEITRLGTALGGKYQSFCGLAGMGDLVTTCMNLKSRNRSLGEQIGKGKALNLILKQSDMVIEGVITTKIALKMAKDLNISMPVTEQVYQVLFKNKKPNKALEALMQRPMKQEAIS